MKEGLIIIVTLLALVSYAGAQSVTTEERNAQSKKEASQTTEHSKHCSKDMKDGHNSNDVKTEKMPKETKVDENK